MKRSTTRAQAHARAGVEGVRACGIRRSRYVGLAKTTLQRVFTAVGINAVRIVAWLDGQARAKTRDLTHIATDEGWLSLAVMIVLFSRQVVDWSLRKDMVREIVVDAVRMAWFKRHPRKDSGRVSYSDRGSQYASQDFRKVVSEYGVTASINRRGN